MTEKQRQEFKRLFVTWIKRMPEHRNQIVTAERGPNGTVIERISEGVRDHATPSNQLRNPRSPVVFDEEDQ